MLEVMYPQQYTEYKRTHALLFYEGHGKTMATLHKVRNRQLLAGKSISVQDVEELFHSENQQGKMIFMPSEVIAWSRNEVVWFEKSRVRPIYFNAPEPERRFLNEISGKNVIWPKVEFCSYDRLFVKCCFAEKLLSLNCRLDDFKTLLLSCSYSMSYKSGQGCLMINVRPSVS